MLIVGGGLAIISLFQNWSGGPAGIQHGSAFDLFQNYDVVLLALAILAVAAALVDIPRPFAAALPIGGISGAFIAGGAAPPIVDGYTDLLGIGVWLAFAGGLTMAAGAVVALAAKPAGPSA
jgi:hypothetical protein